MQHIEKELFEQLAEKEAERLATADEIKDLKKAFTFDKKENPDGLPKETVALVSKAATIYAKNVYEEQRSATKAVFDKYEEMTGY